MKKILFYTAMLMIIATFAVSCATTKNPANWSNRTENVKRTALKH